ncbi:hypothetical protein O0L34_g12480 [Tuta absoluta]|nr:hypothetical protein O0L34_g12480 [Tuta absoluta]
MEMVKVDPKLFVICRLCLEETGMYRINQVVQHQIKYCFDIDVDIHDDLPQLICSQCETILSEYFTKKRIFVGRQNALKAKIEVRKDLEDNLRPSPPDETLSFNQQNGHEEVNAQPRSIAKKRKSRIISSSSSSTSASHPPSREATRSPAASLRSESSTVPKKPKENLGPKKRRESWETNYTKRFGCKLCNKFIKFGGGIGNHVKTHANMLSKYQDIIGNNCKVKLIKIDGIPNPTGDNSTVALTQDKVLGNTWKEHVYVIYTPKENESKDIVENEDDGKMKLSYYESDNDEDDILNKSKHAKRRRLLSKSSTDTVVLNDDDKNTTSHAEKQEINTSMQNEKQEVEDIVTINLDDSSNDSTQNETEKDDDTISITPKDEEAVRNLIKVCLSKYITKRQEMIEAETKQAANKGHQLKRKLLSMGRKVVNKQPVNCTGVLRFMERKNLDIKWIPTTSGNRETNVVRIMPRTKTKEEQVSDNNGWKKKPDIVNKEHVPILPKQGPSNTDCSVSLTSLTPNNSGPEEISVGNYLSNFNMSTVQTSNVIVNPSSAASIETDLFKDLDSDTKLLNAYPVANPKQLPKKSNNIDNKLQSATLEKVVEHPQLQSLYIDLDDDQPVFNVDMPMPIITSTTSLAVTPSNIKKELNDNVNNIVKSNNGTANEREQSSSETEKPTDKTEKPTNDAEKSANEPEISAAEADKPVNEVEKPAPRIKVKPVSELMSQSVLNSYQQSNARNNIWPGNGNATPVISTGNGLDLLITKVTSAGVAVAASQLVPPAKPAPVPSSRNYVILDTVEMPNTKTESPVQYLRNLLHFHNIILLNSNEPLPPNAVCLIKFKLQFIRDSANPPVTLCLSVHCAGNTFSLGVTNPNQDYVDLNNLNASWQWEILKVYIVRQEVIKKMLQNAEKVSQEMYDVTKTFTCLLKSINFKKGDRVC